MSIHILHCLPNRLRLRISELKQWPKSGPWLKSAMLSVPGIKEVRVNSKASSAIMQFDPNKITQAQIMNFFQQLDWQQIEQLDAEPELTRGDVGVNILGSLLAFFLPGHAAALPTLPLITPTLRQGAKQLAQSKMNIEVLDAIAVGLSAARGDYSTAMLTQTLLTTGEFMEQKTCRKSDVLLAELMAPKADQVWVTRSRRKVQITCDSLVKGDILHLSPGDYLPADGLIKTGTALINQSALTGESVPVRREKGAQLYAGSLIQEGNIRLEATEVGEQATTSKIARFIHDSLAEKSETQEVTTKMADRRVKITLGVGSLVFLLTQDLSRLASVFLVDYSCALKLSTPVAFKSAMYNAAKQGLLLKGGRAIEQLNSVDTCIFDKTGTLTFGQMQVTDVVSLNDPNQKARDLLALAASVEEHSNHPLAQAVVNAAKEHELPHIDHGEVEYIIAHGLKSNLGPHQLDIGSRHFLEEHENVDFSSFEEQIMELENNGRHLLYVAKDHILIGLLALKDTVRPEAKQVIKDLRQLGINNLVLLSGDKYSRAQTLASELGMDHVIAQAEPEAKAQVVEQLQQQGHKVMFVGDGINDAPALTAADVGLAMSNGTELAHQAADAVLLKDELSGVVTARQVANSSMQLVQSNIRLTEVINTGIMLAASMGLLHPAASALLHNGTTLGVLLRSLAARHMRH